MKKIISALIALTLIFSFTGCTAMWDTKPATLEITTSEGRSYIASRFNDSFSFDSGSSKAMRHTIKLELCENEKATIHFFCRYCNHDEFETIVAPFAKIYSCDCPEKMDKDKNIREYISLLIRISE